MYNLKKWIVFIGVEIHSRIISKKKLFSNFFVKENLNNNNVIYLDIGVPGVLPLFYNYKILNKIILLGVFLTSIISYISFFVRKNYFYFDMSKNYQITQYKYSLIKFGNILIYNNYNILPYYKIINIKQIHIEEDAGKIINLDKFSKIDFNRSGLWLLEVVSFYNLNNFYEVFLYLNKFRYLISYLGISDCDMHKGNFRFDINLSTKEFKFKNLNSKIEIKNLNSFDNLKDVIYYEIKRQISVLKLNKVFFSETRFFKLNSFITDFIRNKESFLDYKYFKDSDLIYILFSKKIFWKIKKNLPKSFKSFKYLLNKYLKDLNIKFFYFNKIFINLFNKINLVFNNDILIFKILNNLFLNLNFKKIYFSFDQLLVLIYLYLNKYIFYIDLKYILNFIFKNKIFYLYFVYKIINFNKLKIIYNERILNFYINFVIFRSIKLFHNIFINNNIINFLIKKILQNFKSSINFALILSNIKKKLI